MSLNSGSFTMLRLCGPTSMSRDLEIASRFGGSNGMILQLNNTGYRDAHLLRSFDCAWLSQHEDEAEQLFMGGFYRIKIELVRDIGKCRNFQAHFKPLYYFDCMIDGVDIGDRYKYDDMSEYVQVLNHLIKYKLNLSQMEQNTLPQYIYDSFVFDITRHTELIFNLHYIHQYFQELCGLIMHPLIQQRVSIPISMDSSIMSFIEKGKFGTYKISKKGTNYAIYTNIFRYCI